MFILLKWWGKNVIINLLPYYESWMVIMWWIINMTWKGLR
jgi:hypothetical protein